MEIDEKALDNLEFEEPLPVVHQPKPDESSKDTEMEIVEFNQKPQIQKQPPPQTRDD